jgi:capsular polysaccharide biosynthesis protein
MQLDRFISAVMRRWYILVSMAGVGIVAALLFFLVSGSTTATTSVAVLDPAVTQSVTTGTVASSGQAQLTFGSVIQSRMLAERVIQRLALDMPAQAMQGKISVKIASSPLPNVTPLYTIQVKDHDADRALLYANTVVDEGKQLFAQLNSPDRSPVNVALTDQEQQLQRDESAARADLQSQLTKAESELDRLRRLMPTYSSLALNRDQAVAIDTQLASRESDLLLQNQPQLLAATRTAKADVAANLQTARQALAKFQQDNGIDDLNANITAQAALVNGLRGELQGVAPPTGALRTAEDRLNALETRKMELALTSSGTSSTQVKVLDTAYIPTNAVFVVLVYVLALLLGVFVGLAAIYLLEYFERSPHTAEDAEELIGAPVLLRIPEAS